MSDFKKKVIRFTRPESLPQNLRCSCGGVKKRVSTDSVTQSLAELRTEVQRLETEILLDESGDRKTRQMIAIDLAATEHHLTLSDSNDFEKAMSIASEKHPKLFDPNVPSDDLRSLISKELRRDLNGSQWSVIESAANSHGLNLSTVAGMEQAMVIATREQPTLFDPTLLRSEE